jgi:formylglycine-generating enzyme required for sulfatase activity
MGKYEVTQAEWTAVMGSNPSSFGGKHDNKAKGLDTSRFPVESGTWDMICGADGKGGFLAKINAHGGIPKALGKGGRFKLPTEDEWEYACRGGRGNARPFYWGNELNGMQANCKGTDLPYGTTAPGAFLDRPCSVEFTNDGKYPPHPWGLMHMHGNVCEWCDSQYEQIASRVVRGGSWAETAHHCASAARRYALPSTSSTAIGLRVMIALAN